MRSIKRILNIPKSPPWKSLNGIIQSMDSTKITQKTEKNRDDVLVNKLTFENPLEVVLLAKEQVTQESSMFRFMLPSVDKPLGISPGQYVTIGAEINGELIKRDYHPISPTKDWGLIDLLVKIYPRNLFHPAGGIFTQYLDSLKEGDKISLISISSNLEYKGRGTFNLIDPNSGEVKTKTAKRWGMISGGTGITPMYQIIQAVEADPIDTMSISLLSFYQNSIDALMEDDLSRLEQNGIVSYFPVVEFPDEFWVYGEGKISKLFIENFMPPPNDNEGFIIIAGRKEMTEAASKILTEMEYKPDQFHVL